MVSTCDLISYCVCTTDTYTAQCIVCTCLLVYEVCMSGGICTGEHISLSILTMSHSPWLWAKSVVVFPLVHVICPVVYTCSLSCCTCSPSCCAHSLSCCTCSVSCCTCSLSCCAHSLFCCAHSCIYLQCVLLHM